MWVFSHTGVPSPCRSLKPLGKGPGAQPLLLLAEARGDKGTFRIRPASQDWTLPPPSQEGHRTGPGLEPSPWQWGGSAALHCSCGAGVQTCRVLGSWHRRRLTWLMGFEARSIMPPLVQGFAIHRDTSPSSPRCLTIGRLGAGFSIKCKFTFFIHFFSLPSGFIT